jgi:hypothetical protein
MVDKYNTRLARTLGANARNGAINSTVCSNSVSSVVVKRKSHNQSGCCCKTQQLPDAWARPRTPQMQSNFMSDWSEFIVLTI